MTSLTYFKFLVNYNNITVCSVWLTSKMTLYVPIRRPNSYLLPLSGLSGFISPTGETKSYKTGMVSELKPTRKPKIMK